MWNSIKKLFTNSSKINELNIEVNKLKEERDEAKRNYEGVVRHAIKLNDKVEKLEEENGILRGVEKFQEDMEIDVKGESDYDIESKIQEDRDRLFKKIMEGKMGRRITFYHSFIEWTFARLFDIKKGRLNKKILPSSTKHIILDTSVIMEPYDGKGNHRPLKELLDDMEKRQVRGILSKTLIGEYEKQLLNLKSKDEVEFDRLTDRLTVFPVLEMARFFYSCVGIEETENIEKTAEQIRNKISPQLKEKFLRGKKPVSSKEDSFINDTIFAAIAQVHECVLVTNDKALLELGKLHDYKLQIYHHRLDKGFKDYPHINKYIKPLIPVDKKQNQ